MMVLKGLLETMQIIPSKYYGLHVFHISTRGKYCNKNTPNPYPLLSSLMVGSKYYKFQENVNI